MNFTDETIYYSNNSYSDYYGETLNPCVYKLQNPVIEYGFVLSLCFAALVGIIGNGSLILVGLLNTNLRSSAPNILLLQLSFAGLVYIILKVPCAIDTAASSGCWRYGLYGCKLFSFAFMFSRGLMVWTLTASSINLCISLVRSSVRLIPSSRSGLRAASKTIFLTWSWCLVISLPSFFLAELFLDEYHCTSVPIKWDYVNMKYVSLRQLHIWYVIWALLQYILPLIIIGCAYGLIAYRLVQSTKSFNESQPRMKQFFEERRRLVLIFYIITSLFAICWFPFYLFHLWAVAGEQASERAGILKKPSLIAAILFPCIYPWMTYLMSGPYREGVKNIFRGHGYHRVSRQAETCDAHTMHSMNNNYNRSSV